MRIALVSFEVAGVRGGGIGTYVVEAGHALTAAGHDVTLITAAPRDARQREALRHHAGFARVVFVEHVDDPRRPTKLSVAREPLRFSLLAYRALCREVERTHGGAAYDYIEFPDFGAAGYVSVLEHRLFDTFPTTVCAVVLHSPTHECWQYNESLHAMPPSVRETALLEDETIRTAPVLWAPSTRLAEIVAERLGTPGPGPAGTRVIRYPMRVASPPASRAGVAADLSQLRFLYFGRIEPRKGVRQLVDAFARMPELKLEMIGADRDTAPHGSSEIAWLRRCGADNVTFRGALPRERMLQALAEADVVILPSTWENWPNTCIEAMAAGRVVIGGRHGGMGEMIEHGVSGFVCDGQDPRDIERVVREELGAALERLAAIGEAAVARIRALCDPARYVAAIEQLVVDRRPAAPSSAVAAQPVTSSNPRVSVIVPYYDEPLAMVAEAVDSAIAQSERSLEILVVEDGSPRPDAEAILADLAGRDARVRVLRKPNGGLASARNHAINHVRGEFLLFLDADNRLRSRYAEHALHVFDRDESLAAVVPWFETFGDSPRAGTTVPALPFDLGLALVRNAFGDAGAMFRARVFTACGLRYDPLVDVYSDWALWLDCAKAGLQVQQVPRVLYDYRVRPGSMMEQQAWDRHLHLIGLLIERHLPVDDDETRAMLITLTRAWGAGALLAALGGRPEYADRGHQMVEGFRPGRVRYRAADALARIAARVPGATWLVRAMLGRLFRLHGRYKDRRRDG